MMKFNKIPLRWMLIVLAIITPLLIAGYIHAQRDNFSCESHTTIIDNNSIVDMLMTFTVNEGEGIYQSSGEYIKNNQPPLAVSNSVAFDYWREDGRMIMVARETNELPKAILPFRLNIPDFFHHGESGLRMQVIPANSVSYYFIYKNTPIFYCSKE